MQYQVQYHNFNTLLTQFLKLNNGFNIKGQVQSVSRELIGISKQSYFMQLAMQLIKNESEDKDKLIFITSLIKDKFKYDYETVQRQKLIYYYSKICQISYYLGCRYHPVYTNLSLALCYIYIHISARNDEPLQNFLKPFMPKQSKDFQYFNYYFKIIQCLAVQIQNSRLVIDQQYRQIAKSKLLTQQYTILIKLNQITAAAWEIKQIDNQNILQCFIEWVTIQYNPQVLNDLPGHYALNKLFEYVEDERRTNDTSECLKRLISHLQKPIDIPIFYAYLGKKVVELLSIVDNFAQNGQIDQAEEYLRIIVQFSSKSIQSFITSFDDNIYEFLKRLVKYTQDQIVQIFQSLVDFWQEFIEIAIKLNMNKNTKIILLISQVYDAIIQKCKYSVRIIAQLNTRPESKLYDFNRSAEQVCRHRQYSEEIFLKISQFLGKQNYLEMIYQKIKIISQQSQDKLWTYLQIYINSLIDSVKDLQKYFDSIAYIINIYMQLNNRIDISMPIILKKSFLGIFKSLMSIKQKNINFILYLFNLTSTCFQIHLLMPFAEKTFCKGCQYNHSILISNLQDMAPLIQKYPNRQHIVKGIIYLIVHYQDITCKQLPSILTYLFGKLQQSANDRHLNKEILYSLTGVMKVLQQVAPNNLKYIAIINNFTKLAFPYILQVIKNPKRLNNDEDPQVQRMIKLVKIIMRYLKFYFTQFIEPLYSAILQSFPKYPVCSYAYLLQIAITVFYQNQQYTQYFKGIFAQFCNILFVHMNQIQKMEKYSYLLDDFIGICKRFFVYNASILLNSGQLPNIIELCISAFIGSDTPRIARAAYSFFDTIFMVYWRQEFIDDHNKQATGQKFVRRNQDELLYIQLKNLLIEKLQQIVTKIIDHLSTAPSQSTRQHISFALISQVKAFPQENSVIWSKILSKLPADILVANEKTRFIGFLQLVKNTDINKSRDGISQIKRYISIMSKRMVNANKRQCKY